MENDYSHLSENDQRLIRLAQETRFNYDYIGELYGKAESIQAKEAIDIEYKRAFAYEERRSFDCHDYDDDF